MSTELEKGPLEEFSYNDKIVRQFLYATILWGAVGILLGVIIAFQLASWKFNFGLEWFTFGRLRPLHTNAAIFAFCGNAIFAGVYYSTQRLCKARIFNDTLSKIHFWGWQLIIVAAAISLPMGYSHGKEYAELEWPIDLAITVVWVIFAINFFGTLWKRRERHLYVALWFYIATIVTVAVLHIVNSIEIPVTFMKSYPVWAGAQDALIQWWYGHNAVAFFLTTPFLGLMYYFIPKAINRPVYSYRLSIIHFWSLVFIYIWAGPHHLLYTSLPEWAQTLGMSFSIMLWAPSWGGMINGLMTLKGAWDRVRKEPLLKFLATSVTFYGMSTFEGPMMSIKSVNALAHYTDWVVGHVHSGTIGWNIMLVSGILYYIIPKMFKTELFSQKLANFHFWTTTVGLVLYILSMWTAGITQGLMWRGINSETGQLLYPNFVETVTKIVPMYWVRAFGGVLILVGFLSMIYNFIKTIKAAEKPNDNEVFQAHSFRGVDTSKGHRKLEGLTALFTVLTVLAILVGSAIEIMPSILASKWIEKDPRVKPYTALEIAGRDIYIREGCYVCHSQMIRTMAHEEIRYGKPSQAAEFIYDRPFQWGSRRIGPDLQRLGGKYSDIWHYRHMWDPREVTAGSIMPIYPWLFKKKMDLGVLTKKLSVMKALGVPYSDEEIKNAKADALKQAESIMTSLEKENVPSSMKDKQIIALIAYLQRLGIDIQEEEE
ncbi:MAG: cytochrome C oxidase Cbb3 [Halobacteriovorax sp.]|nr:cytochrome C oxidase Cbb3 [Halobacteriovorax sp.]|tara:strand:- start:176323 stop:178458 length:2136 start_codon:yes stop_codon:yes gene_type:complete